MDLINQSMRDDKEPEKEKLIVMHGPLSELIYRALNGVYAKNGDEAMSDLSLETIAQDEVLADKILEANQEKEDEPESADLVVFGINKTEVEPETFVEVKNILSTNKNNATFVLFTNDDSYNSKDIADHAPQSNMNGHYSNMVAALESYVKNHNGLICHSVRELTNIFKG